MTQIAVETLKVNSEFIMREGNKPCIIFADPSYLRADSILLNHEENTAYAVMHESMFLIGDMPDKFAVGNQNIELCAVLPCGESLSLSTPIADKSETINQIIIYPSFSAGGHAMTTLA